MKIHFDDEMSFEGSTMLCHATADGRRIICKAGIDVVAELDDRASQSGKPMGKEAVAKNLRPFFSRKIENGSYDDEDRNTVTLQVHEVVSFMQETDPTRSSL
jgi:hypothetical protein